MPRRQFVADLAAAQAGTLPLGISHLCAGEDDGQFDFEFVTTSDPICSVRITALVPELGDYPKSHEYMLYADDTAPPDISRALQSIRSIDRKPIIEVVDVVASTLRRLRPDADGDSVMTQEDDFEVIDDDDDDNDDLIDHEEFEDDIYDSDHEAFQDSQLPRPTSGVGGGRSGNGTTAGEFSISTPQFRARLKRDLIVTKNAGFKVAALTRQILNGGAAYVSISVRAAKLRISAEAMEAWQIEPQDYVTLILRYANGYKTHEELLRYDATRLKNNIDFRVVAGKNYKPTLQDAIKTFTTAREVQSEKDELESSFLTQFAIRDTFISKPLTRLLEEGLIPILALRSEGMFWHAAEEIFANNPNSWHTNNQLSEQGSKPEKLTKTFAPLLQVDHFNDASSVAGEHSFPLLAMQFMIRRFVRCTEFCLVCHRHLDTEIEALKPYVCDRPLCLFQYMTMGFGPGVEHEIATQPYVVDLLVSFCYRSAAARRLKMLPDGLYLTVPPADYDNGQRTIVQTRNYNNLETPPLSSAERVVPGLPSWDVGFDRSTLELIFWERPDSCPVRTGTWIVVSFPSENFVLHCRVKDATFFPTIRLDEPIDISGEPLKNGKGLPAQTRSGWVPATFQTYCQSYDGLTPDGKLEAICRLLDTLPSVTDMQAHIARGRELRQWPERISSSALSLFTWIIASNRACIMQVDKHLDLSGATPTAEAQQNSERVYGMPGHVQFRFAMGAPDKEQRFRRAVHDTQQRLNLTHPTIFAWHGSPLHNWHMIVREGLHYQNTDHGRAYGHGVYHAKDAQTSSGYAGNSYGARYGEPSDWPHSVLRVQGCLALSEIVNAPSEFVSENPYYVVQHLDWIQTRYLFVRCTSERQTDRPQQLSRFDPGGVTAEMKPKNPYPQDPARTPMGTNREPIIIPASAIRSSAKSQQAKTGLPQPSSWHLANTSSQASSKKNTSAIHRLSKRMKLGSRDAQMLSHEEATAVREVIVIDDDDDDPATMSDADSIATDPADLEILFPDTEQPTRGGSATPTPQQSQSPSQSQALTTDFVPGALNHEDLPMLPMPSYATRGTTQHLMKELKALEKVQSSAVLAELGWHIDFHKIENVYQWIVELHSFHTFRVSNVSASPSSSKRGRNGDDDDSALIPLAADMKARDLRSIVMELRFPRDYPFSPPYARILRPRFLTMAQGGGGHVVMGGALCMELLTNTGWSSVSALEGVLLQIRMAMASEPYARLAPSRRSNGKARAGYAGSEDEYGAGEAADGYLRACRAHGWAVPPGFQEMAYGLGAGGAYAS